MDRRHGKQAKTGTCCSEAEVSSIEWEFINMSEQEEDLIYRMYKLVGDRWPLIAGRIPGRKAEEIERFWLMRHGEIFATRRKGLQLLHHLRAVSNNTRRGPPQRPAALADRRPH
ncbi:hypothetical protein SAY87_019555 [Trapa incisa]|uniref:Myb-like domain-containing protein n=1 Tax=Trapa incisa TaxID=236973 RepID=A0AAN7Q338_9MYRT|nr:hypothetical protein SAY87_019555 [Trapa incisa]